MITITLQPTTPEQLDAAMALLKRIRDDQAASDAQFARLFAEVRQETMADPAPAEPPVTAEREPGADETEPSVVEPTVAPVAEPPKVKRVRKTPPPALVQEANTSPEPVQNAPEIEQIAPPAAPAWTLEQVRETLAALSQGGKRAEVMALFSKFGAVKLTDIPSDKFGELMAAAKEL